MLSLHAAVAAPQLRGCRFLAVRGIGRRPAPIHAARPAQAPGRRSLVVQAKKNNAEDFDLSGEGWTLTSETVKGNVEAAVEDVVEEVAPKEAAAAPVLPSAAVPAAPPSKLDTAIASAVKLIEHQATRTILAIPVIILGYTLAQALWKTYQKVTSSRSKRVRQINRNLTTVTGINEYLPDRRAELTPKVLKGISGKTGFSPDLLFRKYLRYLLNEREFDTEAVADLLHLKNIAGLSDEDLAEIINETGRRVFDKSGILMLKPSGMTLEGLKRKATGRLTFSKLLYLAELPEFLTPGTEAAESVDLAEIFGATEEDVDSVRITSLSSYDGVDDILKVMVEVNGGSATLEEEGEAEGEAEEEAEGGGESALDDDDEEQK